MPTRGSYGVDAPGLVRAFLLVGICFSAAGGWILRWSASRGWTQGTAGLLFVLSAYGFGMFFYMLWGSLITKVRGRDAILDLIHWTGREQVLDVGCGKGLLLVAAARRLTTGHATGIDLWVERDQSSNCKEATLKNAATEGVADRVSVETGDMRNLPFADGSFDVVVSHWAVHNLEHPTDRTDALAEMVRTLRPGGVILLTDIACHPEYQIQLERLGMTKVQLVIGSSLINSINKLVSFGSFQPATIIAKWS